MQEHFRLQLKIAARYVRAWGAAPGLFVLGALVLFILLSEMLFVKLTTLPEYIYAALSLSLLSPFRHAERSEFIYKLFTAAEYRKIRLTEHLFALMPSVFFLLYKTAFIAAGALLVLGLVLSFIPEIKLNSRTLPTPFGRFPFEFPVGFRTYFPVFILAFVINLIALYVGNFNLALFAVIIPVLVCGSFYAKPEPQTYIKAYALNRKAFLFEKLKTAWLCSFILIAPSLLILSACYPEKTGLTLLLLCFALLWLSAAVIGKYASYPGEWNILEGFALGLSLAIPPLLFLVLPWFFKKANKNSAIRLRES